MRCCVFVMLLQWYMYTESSIRKQDRTFHLLFDATESRIVQLLQHMHPSCTWWAIDTHHNLAK